MASYRATRDDFEMTFMHVASRAHLVAQDENTNWGKIKAKFTRRREKDVGDGRRQRSDQSGKVTFKRHGT